MQVLACQYQMLALQKILQTERHPKQQHTCPLDCLTCANACGDNTLYNRQLKKNRQLKTARMIATAVISSVACTCLSCLLRQRHKQGHCYKSAHPALCLDNKLVHRSSIQIKGAQEGWTHLFIYLLHICNNVSHAHWTALLDPQ